MPKPSTTPAPPDRPAIRHLLSAVHQALGPPAPFYTRDQVPYLTLLEQRARIARASLARLLSDSGSEAADYMSEGDHILHQIADLPVTYRHRHAEGWLEPGGRPRPVKRWRGRVPGGGFRLRGRG